MLLQRGVAENNLRAEADARGVDPQRLVFAPWASYQDYLARYTLADLFLDTTPFGGGTTTSDALWAGLPVVTLLGEAFASRMTGSLLRSVGLPELIAESADEYEALALRLARDLDLRGGLKSRLVRNRETMPVFNTRRFTRHLETAYTMMWERHRRGERAESFDVPSLHEAPE
jgi:predicted O-linked N-acetylglucosamine transferase (SPINDLY family)